MKKYDIAYDRKEITPGILHFGVGNFHRAHEEYYTNLLLADPDQKNWGICGAMIHERGKGKFQKLKDQDGCYGLTVFGRTGLDEYYRIGSLVELLWGVEDPESILNKIADPQIRIISLTITEGGYNLDSKTQEFDYGNEDILYDLGKPARPRTVFGYIASGLMRRMERNAGPITILSCDNLRHNGDVCKRSFHAFFQRADTELYHWVKENVSFPNSMVDRITPATLPEDVERLQELSGYVDAVPVYCEDYVQWVIEDVFPGGRPAWERVGVEFTDDVSKYESMKLALVNSVHQMMSFPGFVAGYRKVDEAVADVRIEKLLRKYMELDVIPYLDPPPHTDLKAYGEIFMERLKNKMVSDQIARLCFDAANKNPVYIIPRMTTLIAEGGDLSRITLFVSAYRQYLRKGVDDRGVSYTVDDPGLTENDYRLIRSDDPVDFLKVSCFDAFGLADSGKFVKCYVKNCQDIEEKGVMKTIEGLLA